ncbi:APC family permease [Nocardioides panacis]|uniref:APC family permease n=1 Tax=Nocardioides panacis TaxID=2849501 RepID=A0A975SXK7_9ACTN|nr:APC family permease [Nocardioides panacis]QWZ07799.1 APC family permease [Nocardioides panacis]
MANAPSGPHPTDTVHIDIDGDTRLRQLGYRPRLERGLTTIGSVILTLSDITPAGSLLIVGLAVVAVAGTGSVLAYLAGATLAVMVALCMAELGALYPIAGGIYSIVARVLGTWAAFLTLLSYVVQAIFLPASIALGVGIYLNSLNDVFPVNLSAAIAMVIVTGLAMLKIHVNALMTALFLALEMVVIVVIAVAGFSNPTQSVSTFLDPMGVVDGTLQSFGTGAVVAAVAIALQSVNGYDAAISFAEETKGSTRNVGKAVLVSCLVGVGLELAAFLGAAFGAPDLKAFLSSSTPLTYVVEQHWGHTAATILIIGAVIAFFNACLAITLQFARVLWASGRDGIWPSPVSKALQRLLPATDAPWVATLVVGVCATILCFASDIVAVVTFVSVLTISIYVFVGVTTIVSRQRDKTSVRTFRLPLYPVPPVLAILGALLALSQQARKDLIAVAIIYALGLAYYFFYLRSRRDAMAALREPQVTD